MTRRFFAQLLVGITLAMPIRSERREPERASFVEEVAGPLSPLRRNWEPLDMDKFFIGLQKDLFDRGIAFV